MGYVIDTLLYQNESLILLSSKAIDTFCDIKDTF